MYYSIDFRAMGCQMLAALDLPAGDATRLLAQAPGWFAIWEASLSRFRPDSELSQINSQPGTAVPVSETMWQVLQVARRVEAQSAGLVTPVLLEALLAAGYTTSFDRLDPQQGAGRVASPPVYSLQEVKFQPQQRTVCLPQGLRLDLGGVAKGWAAQSAMRLLEKYGPALVDAGGDIAISGLQSGGQPWLVGIDDPRRPGESLATLRLGRCGVATSGRDRRRWTQGGQWKHHIIDPRTGEPAATDVLTATVIAPNVLEAEMAAKVVLLRGSREGMAWLGQRPELAGVVVTEDGNVLTSRSFELLG